MQRTSRRVASSTAIPATLKPHHAAAFKPSSVLSSDIHWRKMVKRKTKGTGRTMKKRPVDASATAAATATAPGGKPPKIVTSEYIDKFVEWDIPEMYEKKIRSVHHRNNGSLIGGALTGMYENDLTVADWQSEQKRSYVPMVPSTSTQKYEGPTNTHRSSSSMINANESSKIAGFVKPKEGSVSSAFMWDDEDHRLMERPYEG